MMRALIVALAGVLVLAACAGPADPGLGDGSPDPPSGTAEVAADCVDLEPEPERDPGREVDGPLPDAAEDAQALRQWAEAEAPESFAGLWLDQAAGGLTVAFADDVDVLEREVRDRFGDDVRVVEADHPYTELSSLVDEVSEEMGQQHADASEEQRRYPEAGTIVSVGVAEQLNRVRIGVIDGDDALVGLSERYGADRICLDRHAPAEPPDLDDGPVRPLAKADGWRDGLSQPGSPFAVLEVAFDRGTAEAAWADNVPDGLAEGDDVADAGVFATLEAVDFDAQAVVVWSSGQSGSCPGWLADVRTADDGAVALERDAAGGPACTDDYNPYRMVLAVDRDRLPDAADLPTEDVDGVPDGRVTTYPAEG